MWEEDESKVSMGMGISMGTTLVYIISDTLESVQWQFINTRGRKQRRGSLSPSL